MNSPQLSFSLTNPLSASSEEILRRLIERMNIRVEKRLDELQLKVGRVERELDQVRTDEAKVHGLQKEHYEKFVEFSSRRSNEVNTIMLHALLQFLSEYFIPSLHDHVCSLALQEYLTRSHQTENLTGRRTRKNCRRDGTDLVSSQERLVQ